MSAKKTSLESVIGSQIGSYEILSVLGAGGMGVVYLAQHQRLPRKAAIKVLLPEATRDPHLVSRFLAEAQAASVIHHPGVVQIYDSEEVDGTVYIAMEYLEGESLKERLARKRRMSLTEAVEITRQVAAALAHVHQLKIVHRDLKPDNIFIIQDSELGERVKILDFGIAKLTDSGLETGHVTRTNMLMGTPAYMSPEQCRGAGKVDHRADLYSLGCILFKMLCGQSPFSSEGGAGTILGAHIFKPPPEPRAIEPSIPHDLQTVILRLLEKDCEQRYQSANELMADLPGVTVVTDMRRLDTEPTMHGIRPHITEPVAAASQSIHVPKTSERSRHWRLVLGAALAAVLLVTLAAWQMFPHNPEPVAPAVATSAVNQFLVAQPGTMVAMVAMVAEPDASTPTTESATSVASPGDAAPAPIPVPEPAAITQTRENSTDSSPRKQKRRKRSPRHNSVPAKSPFYGDPRQGAPIHPAACDSLQDADRASLVGSLKAHQARKYRIAIKSYRRLSRVCRDPALLFNRAQANWKSGALATALTQYERFITRARAKSQYSSWRAFAEKQRIAIEKKLMESAEEAI